MKSFIFILKSFFVCILVALSACATRSETALRNVETSAELQPASLELAISESLGKTILDFPVSASSQMYADYKPDNLIEVYFVPGIVDFSIANVQTDLVRTVAKFLDGDKVNKLQVSLKTKCKFLLSRQGDNSGRLMLVADVAEMEHSQPSNYITSLNFKVLKDVLQVTTSSSLPFEITPQSQNPFVLNFGHAQFKDSLIKKYDLSQIGGEGIFVSARNTSSGNSFLEFSGYSSPELSVQRTADQTMILVRGNASMSPVARRGTGRPVEMSFAEDSDIPEMNTLYPGMKERYTGERISIDLQDADVEHVLRLISEISGFNLILDDEVKGKISLKLVDIPWDQALDLVLLQKDLGMVLKGNIMRIASTNKLEGERAQMQRVREAALKAKKSMEDLAPLKTEYIQINYNTAADFEGKLKGMLSPRGKISSDSRTNILIVTDTNDSLKRISSYIKKLDRAERQVMIEARLVYATDEFQRSLGVNWGTSYSPSDSSDSVEQGQLFGEAAIASVGLNSLSTASGVALGGSIGKLFGNDLFELDATLQLGEAKNLVKTISAPRILTLNNNRAEIQQGTKLATATESQSGGTTTEYEEAVLKISVLPQITPDNKLILDLEISDDSPKSDGRDIDTKQTKTKMMVNNGETIVIGGVQKTTDTSGIGQIPGLGDVPGMGWLFKNEYRSKTKAELLIFIHPKIM